MHVIAHRGASSALPDNSLAAFHRAVELVVDGVELDVRRTADGALALSHDPALPDGRLVVDVTEADLPPGVPVLAQALDICRPLAVVNIEIKNLPPEPDFDPCERVAGAVVALLAERGEQESGRNLVSSFHLETIDRVHELAPSLGTAWLMTSIDDLGRVLDTTVRRGHVALHPHHAFLNAEVVAAAHEVGVAVNTWTCDDAERIRWLAKIGVDAVVTNVPDVARAALGR